MEIYEIFIPISFFAMIASIVISNNRFKLAKLQITQGGNSQAEIERLEREVKELKNRFNEQAIELDGVNKLIRGMNQSPNYAPTESAVLKENL